MPDKAPTLTDLFLAHNDLVVEIAHANARVTERYGIDAPRRLYRNAVEEIKALHPELQAVGE